MDQCLHSPPGDPFAWVPVYCILTKDLIDGKRDGGPLMRKWTDADGKYLYRTMTLDEEQVYAQNHAW